MSNTAQMLENSISNLCRQFIPVYTDLVMNVVRTPMSDDDINSMVLLAQSQYFLSVFNKLESGFSDTIKGRIGYALNYPSSIGLPPVMKLDYLEDHGISAGTIFAVLYYAIEGTAARAQVLIETMSRLDNLQIQLMDGVWKDIMKSVQSTRKNNTSTKQTSSQQEQKPKETFLDKVKAVYNSLNRDSAANIFPGGVAQLSRVIKSLAYILNIDVEKCTVEKLSKLIDLYSFIELRQSVKGVMNQRIVTDLCQHFKTLINDDEAATKVIAFWTLHSNDKMFELSSDSDIQIWNTTVQYINTEIDIIKKNTEKANHISPDNDLGNIATKPLYSNSKEATEEYLEHLVASDGRKLKYKHIGDTSAVGILGKVDIYAMSTIDGNAYGTLYINQHSEYIPNFAPYNYRYIVDPSHYEEPMHEQKKDCITSPEIQYCRRCGNKIHPGSVYCNKCGTKIKIGD